MHWTLSQLRSTTAATFFVLAAISPAQGADPPAVGEPAPAFSLPDQSGHTRTLDDFPGRWLVLYFYPKDGTPGCTTQACALRDDIVRIRALGARVLGVSLDSVDSHRQFAGEHELPFLLLADEDGEVADRYGALRNLLVTRLARRHTFVIDPERRIAARFLNVDPDDHSADVIRFLEQVTADPD